MITSRLAYSSIFSQKMEMNLIMEDASSLRGSFDVDAWCMITVCISIHRGYTSNFTEGNGFPWDSLRGGKVPKLAGLPTPWVKKIFILCILKIKIHPMSRLDLIAYVELKL